MAKNYHDKAPKAEHFASGSTTESGSEKASLPHPLSIRVGKALVHWVPSKSAWAAPYNRHSDPGLQWIHTKKEAKLLAERICLLLGK